MMWACVGIEFGVDLQNDVALKNGVVLCGLAGLCELVWA